MSSASAIPRILVVGAGSIGSRHARNLLAAGARVSITDVQMDRVGSGVLGSSVGVGLAEAASYDGVVIATPTSLHAEQLLTVANAGVPVLVEKPIATRSTDLTTLMMGAPVMVGYNLRFHEPLLHFMDLVHDGIVGQIRGVRLWFGSYLPDWRPNVDYRQTYSAQAALGGGVLLDAIHELDLLLWLFDEREDAAFMIHGAFVARLGELEIDTEDTMRAVLSHSSGSVVSIELDYLSRRYRRGIEVVGQRGTLRLDWSRQVIEQEVGDEVRIVEANTDIEQSYEREIACFLNWVRGDTTPPVDAAQGIASLRLAERLRSPADSREGGAR